MTLQQCKSLIFKLGLKYGIAPRLISERLLSSEDKEDMLNDLLPSEVLDSAVALWKEDGMRNYADGSGSPYKGRQTSPYSAKG